MHYRYPTEAEHFVDRVNFDGPIPVHKLSEREWTYAGRNPYDLTACDIQVPYGTARWRWAEVTCERCLMVRDG